MKISDVSGRANAVGGASSVAPAAKSGVPAGGSASGAPASATTDQVQLSSLAKMGAIYEDSAAHISKLSSLSASVASGGYHVAAAVLSNSIIEASMQLNGNYV